MANSVQRVDYYYTEISNRAGAGAKVLNAFASDGVNLIVYNGFPISAFLVQGDDRMGAVADIVSKMGQARINITAIQAITAGEGRYGAILWVKPRNVDKAAQKLGVC